MKCVLIHNCHIIVFPLYYYVINHDHMCYRMMSFHCLYIVLSSEGTVNIVISVVYETTLGISILYGDFRFDGIIKMIENKACL